MTYSSVIIGKLDSETINKPSKHIKNKIYPDYSKYQKFSVIKTFTFLPQSSSLELQLAVQI